MPNIIYYLRYISRYNCFKFSILFSVIETEPRVQPADLILRLTKC